MLLSIALMNNQFELANFLIITSSSNNYQNRYIMF